MNISEILNLGDSYFPGVEAETRGWEGLAIGHSAVNGRTKSLTQIFSLPSPSASQSLEDLLHNSGQVIEASWASVYSFVKWD